MTTPTDSRPILVDSSGWIEYFAEGPKADFFAPFLEQEDKLLVPSIVIYEVFRKLSRASGSAVAQRFLSQALRAQQVSFDSSLAFEAVKVSAERGLAMADSIIYATAQAYRAQLISGDLEFRGLPGVVAP